MNDPIPGFYYKQDLTKAPKPSDDDYFLVEKTLKTKIVKKEKFYLIKVISDLAFPHFVNLIFVFCVTIFCNLYCCRPRSNLKFIWYICVCLTIFCHLSYRRPRSSSKIKILKSILRVNGNQVRTRTVRVEDTSGNPNH